MSSTRICIIAFKNAQSTIHVLRQIDYLSQHYELSVIANGAPDPEWKHVTWHTVPLITPISKYLTRLFLFGLGRLLPSMYDVWYWNTKAFKEAYRYAAASRCDAIHANDWQSLPIAIEVARRTKA